MNWLGKQTWKNCFTSTFPCFIGCSVGTIGTLFFLVGYYWIYAFIVNYLFTISKVYRNNRNKKKGVVQASPYDAQIVNYNSLLKLLINLNKFTNGVLFCKKTEIYLTKVKYDFVEI